MYETCGLFFLSKYQIQLPILQTLMHKSVSSEIQYGNKSGDKRAGGMLVNRGK